MLKLFLFFPLFLFFLNSAEGALKQSMKPERITVFLDENMPYSGFNAKLKVHGLFADFWQAWSDDTGIAVEFESYHEPELVQLLMANKAAVYSGLGHDFEPSVRLQKSILFTIKSQFYYFPTRSIEFSSSPAGRSEPITVGGLLPNANQLAVFTHTPNLTYKEYSGLFEILIAICSGDIDAVVLFTANQKSQNWLDQVLLLIFDKAELQPAENALFAYTSTEQQPLLDWIEWGNKLDSMDNKITSALEKASLPLWGASSEMVINFLLFFCISSILLVYRRSKNIRKDQFNDIVDSSPYPVAVFSLDGSHIFYLNDELRMLFSFKKNKRQYLFKEPENQILLSRLISNASHQIRIEDSPIRLRFDDIYRDIEVSTKRIHYKGQTAWLCHLKDITGLLLSKRQLLEQSELLTKLLDAMPEQVAFKSSQGTVIGCNQSWAKAHNSSIKDATGRNFVELMPVEMIKKHKEQEILVWKGETYKTQEWREQKNKPCLFDSSKIPLYNGENKVFALLTIDNDITHLHDLHERVYDEKSQRLEKEKELLKQGVILTALFEKSIDPMGMIDCDGRVIAANKSFSKLLVADSENIIGILLKDLPPSQGLDWAERNNQDVIDSGVAVSFEELIFSEGKQTWYEVHKEQESDSRFVVIIAQDISERKKTARLMSPGPSNSEQPILSDKLTAIANRQVFEIEFHHLWTKASEEQELLSLIMCDIDFFNSYNNKYDQDKGDQALRIIAATLQAKSKQLGCFFARYGGAQFVIVIKGGNATKALRVAQGMHLAVDELQLENGDSSVNGFISLSMGLASIFPSKLTTPQKLMAEVDAGLCDAKMAGKNQIGVH